MKKIILVTFIMSLFISLTSESDADSASVNVSKILSSSFSSVIDSAPQERSFTRIILPMGHTIKREQPSWLTAIFATNMGTKIIKQINCT